MRVNRNDIKLCRPVFQATQCEEKETVRCSVLLVNRPYRLCLRANDVDAVDPPLGAAVFSPSISAGLQCPSAGRREGNADSVVVHNRIYFLSPDLSLKPGKKDEGEREEEFCFLPPVGRIHFLLLLFRFPLAIFISFYTSYQGVLLLCAQRRQLLFFSSKNEVITRAIYTFLGGVRKQEREAHTPLRTDENDCVIAVLFGRTILPILLESNQAGRNSRY